MRLRGTGWRARAWRATWGVCLLVGLTFAAVVAGRGRFESPAATWLLRDRHGRFLAEVGAPSPAAEFGYWPLDALPPRIVAATLAVEDRRFWNHAGVDVLAAGRAILQNLREGRRVSGASTIAMQVARMQRPGRRTLIRKAVESATALVLTARYGRDAVLAQYLRLAPYGNRIHGISYAARRYLDKPVDDLSWAETAFLTAIPQAPGRMNPFDPLGRRDAVARGRQILDLLRARGDLSATEHEVALQQIERLDMPPRGVRPIDALHAVLRFAQQLQSARPAGAARPHLVDTTIDLDVQALAARLVTQHLRACEGRGAGNAALVVVDPGTGALLASVGSAGYFDEAHRGAVDYTRVPRSPGSILKPFVYALALERGILTPATILDDLERGAGGITNADERFLGPLLPRVALANSRNVPAANLLAQVGLDDAGAFLRDLELYDGERPIRTYGLGLAIGALPVTLEQLVRAYQVLAGDGQASDLVWRKDEQAAARRRRLLSRETVRLVSLFLADPQARLPSFPRMGATEYAFPVAVKTGTSSNYRDAWTVAWSRRYLVGAWVGHPDNYPMERLSGASAAAWLVRDVLTALQPEASAGLDDLALPPPEGYRSCRICALTGRLATPACDRTFDEWFAPGSPPVEPCRAHRRIALDTRTGLPAAARTPPNAVEVRTFVDLDPRYAAWAERAGLPRLPFFGGPGAGPGPGAGGDIADRGPRATAVSRASGPLHVRVTQPENGAVLLRDPETPAGLSTLSLAAVVDPPVPEIVWYVDGLPWRTVDYPYSTRWPIGPGEHTFEARLPRSTAGSRRVRVIVR